MTLVLRFTHRRRWNTHWPSHGSNNTRLQSSGSSLSIKGVTQSYCFSSSRSASCGTAGNTSTLSRVMEADHTTLESVEVKRDSALSSALQFVSMLTAAVSREGSKRPAMKGSPTSEVYARIDEVKKRRVMVLKWSGVSPEAERSRERTKTSVWSKPAISVVMLRDVPSSGAVCRAISHLLWCDFRENCITIRRGGVPYSHIRW